jgi:hypothetical protein
MSQPAIDWMKVPTLEELPARWETESTAHRPHPSAMPDINLDAVLREIEARKKG